MTDRSTRPSRWSPARIRAAAWLAGSATALASGVALAAAPQPPSDAASRQPRRDPAPPRRVIERHVIRRVVIVDSAPTAAAPVSAPTVVVQAPAAAPVPAPPPAPAPATTGGS